MIAPVLKVETLTGPAGAVAIFDISMAVNPGCTTVVLGPIHAGKTMLMRHLVGLEAAEHGTITVDGESFDARGEPDVVLRRMRARIGVVFQGAALISRLSALDNVELPLLEHTNATGDEASDAAHALLAEAGLVNDHDTDPAQLGRAAQRRVALARALALRPPVMLLDEPTQGLDPHAASELDETLARLQSVNGFGLVIFSHDVRYAFGRADQIYVMSNGSVIEQGSPEAVRESDNDVVHRLLNRRGAA
ncbi:MAG: ATP-binding cassette domain-containing protein [Gemmatimonadota bacterium]|nr:ATP-binding cassette domain-containing protein [Gemmatimonadota bacterium]